jgi:hypothetical protein
MVDSDVFRFGLAVGGNGAAEIRWAFATAFRILTMHLQALKAATAIAGSAFEFGKALETNQAGIYKRTDQAELITRPRNKSTIRVIALANPDCVVTYARRSRPSGHRVVHNSKPHLLFLQVTKTSCAFETLCFGVVGAIRTSIRRTVTRLRCL